MKKHLITIMLLLVCMLAMVVSVNAEKYEVSSDSEYEEVYEKAVNGDTIVVNGKLTADIMATKSVTYVLKADWESAKLVINQSNVEVTFVADGGDYRIMPTDYSTTQGWMHIAEVYENVIINVAGINGGTLTIDGTNATHDRVSYVTASNTADITWNLFDGSAIANFNPKTADTDDKAFIIYARTINMYKGSRVYANRIIGAPLMRATYFNLFDGEIFGNVLESKKTSAKGSGAIFASERIMVYGGKIYKNIFNAKGNGQNNMIGFFTTPSRKDTVVLNVQIGDTYVTGTGSTEVSAMFGTTTNQFNVANFYYNSQMGMGTRYVFTGAPTLAYDTEAGETIWQVSSYTVNSQNWKGRSWTHTEVVGDGSVVFLDAEKKKFEGASFDAYKLINAYVKGVYAYSGSTTVAIPGGYTLWSTSGDGYCHDGRAYTLDEVNSSVSITLYSAYVAEKVTVDGTLMCADCGKVDGCINPEHDLQIVSIIYGKYTENGIKVVKCNTCGLENPTNIIASPIFKCLGYSAPNSGVGSITIGFTVNNKALQEYEAVTGKVITYGVFAVLEERLGDSNVFAENGTAADGVLFAEMSKYPFSIFELKISGFTDEQKDVSLAIGAYSATTGNGTTEYSYMQGNEPAEGAKYSFVSYNGVIGSLNTGK